MPILRQTPDFHSLPVDGRAGVRSFRATRTPTGTTTFAMSEVYSGRLLAMSSKSLPDQRAAFEAFARDLKTEVERS